MTASLGSAKSESLSAAPLSVRSIEQHLLFSAFSRICGANHVTCGPAAWLLEGTGSGRPLGLTGGALKMAAPTGEDVSPLLISAKHANEGGARRAGSGRRDFRIGTLSPSAYLVASPRTPAFGRADLLQKPPRPGWGGMEHQSNDALASRIVAKYMAGIVGEAELISLSRRPR